MTARCRETNAPPTGGLRVVMMGAPCRACCGRVGGPSLPVYSTARPEGQAQGPHRPTHGTVRACARRSDGAFYLPGWQACEGCLLCARPAAHGTAAAAAMGLPWSANGSVTHIWHGMAHASKRGHMLHATCYRHAAEEDLGRLGLILLPMHTAECSTQRGDLVE